MTSPAPSEEGVQYCFDTSAVSDIYVRHYPQRVFQSLAQQFEGLIDQAIIIAPEEVYEELCKSHKEDLEEWAKAHRDFFIRPDACVLQNIATLVNDKRLTKFLDTKKEDHDADPHLVSLALCKNATIVTSEQPNHPGTNPQTRWMIPDVCKLYGVRCISLVEFFEEQGWVF